jgi:predicted metal-dependent peptidase
MAKNIAAEEHVRAGRAKAAFLRSYFAHALYALIPVESASCPTMSVDKFGRMYFNPTWVLSCSVDEIATVCLHEIGHVLRRHHERAAGLGVTEATHMIANIAMDCFPAGTMLADGLPIEAARSRTLGGNGGDTACHNLVREWDGETVTLRGAGIEITSTPEHPFWIYPRRHKVGLTPVKIKDPTWIKAGEVRVGDFMLVPNVGGDIADTSVDMSAFGGNENRSSLKNGFPLNEQTAWLLGLHTAEGSGSDYAQLSLGCTDKERALADRAATIARSLGYEGTCDPAYSGGTKIQNGIRVNLGGPVLARALKSWCGDGAHNKRCPEFILRHADTRLVRAYLDGLWAGDGTAGGGRRSANHVAIHTSSRGLAAQVRLLLARLGLGFWGTTIIQKDRKIQGRFIHGGMPLYQVGWTWEPRTGTRSLNGKTVTSWSRSWRRCDEGILIPIREVARGHHTGPIYNLSCDASHTFIAEGVKVHNCELNDDIADEVRTRRDLAPLPGDCMYPSTFGFEDGKLWEVYYAQLLDEPEKHARKIGGDSGDGNENGGGKSRGGGDAVKHRKHKCGSGATGVPQPWEEPSPSKGGREGIEEADWKDIEGRVARAIREEAQKSRGTVPGAWVEWADAILRPQPIPWDQELAGACRVAINDVAGKVIHNYKRPSRRQQATPDVVFPAMRRPVPSVAFVGDTSGSMSENALALVRGVVEDVCLALGASLAFIATDAAAHEVQRATSGRTVEMRGRGGTDMRVGIASALEDVMPRPDVIIVASDCETPWPDEEPNARVIICAIEAREGTVQHCPEWARVIMVEEES